MSCLWKHMDWGYMENRVLKRIFGLTEEKVNRRPKNIT
jgi:hypothetical protein